MAYDLLLTNADVFTPGGLVRASLGIVGERVAAIGIDGPAARSIDCTGLTILPGVIDTQVHFREPGLTHKEDLESGSRAAVLGGITGVFEMPNTNPNTDSVVALEEKLARARGRMWCDHAFYAGATHDNADDLAEIEMTPGCAGVKIFMGSSTGNLLIADDEGLARILRSGRRRVAIHAEDEPRLLERLGERIPGDPRSHPVWRDPESALRATHRAIAAARAANRRVHILHISNPDELAFLAGHKDIASAEATPNHLTLAAEDAYPRLGTYAQMNPPVRDAAARAGLWHWLGQGVVDVIGSDHAPHTLEEKAREYPASPSGMPGVQTLLPIMLDHVAAGRLSLARLVDLTSTGAARLFGIVGAGRIAVGQSASLTVVDLAARWTIDTPWLASRAGWSPFTGMEVTGRPIGTIVRGQPVMWEGELQGAARGAPFRFEETMARG
jgi:dihydroorotase